MEVSSTNAVKASFITHFLLTTWGAQGYWSPDSYLFYNLIFLLLIGATIHSNFNADLFQLTIAVNIASVLLDIIVLTVYTPAANGSNERFSFAMAIVNLIVRPVTTLVFCKYYSSRDGGQGFPDLFQRNGPGTYEDIERA